MRAKLKSGILAAALMMTAINACGQITSAEERIRRQSNNARPSLTVDQVIATQIDIGDKVFNLSLDVSTFGNLEQIEANRWQISIAENGDYKGELHFPRAGVKILSTLKKGDVVIARIKQGATLFTLEILGVSAVNVWE